MTRPPVASSPLRKPRRLTFSMMRGTAVMSRSGGSRLCGGGDALVAATSADVAAHRVVDLGLGRVLRRRQQRGGLHDLAGLTIAALRHIQSAPRLLYRVVPLTIEPLDCRHRAVGGIADGCSAGTGGLAIEMHSAGGANSHT